MNKWKWAAALALLIILGRMEHTGSQINDLEPVETVLVTEKEGNLIIQTDTGAKGVGTNLEKAVENLHSSTAGVVFLDTAQYLLVSSRTVDLLDDMNRWIRPAARVCMIRGETKPEEATRYLKIHPPEIQLKDITAGDTELQVLYLKEGRGQLAR